MPTIRPASMASRKTMTSVASMLLRDDDALRRRGMIFAHERITPRRERADMHIARIFAGDNFFHLERGGIEFLGCGVGVAEPDHDGRVRLHMDFRRREFVILER